MDPKDWRLLLRFILAQRLELNAMASALKGAKVLTDSQMLEIRTQASRTAESWGNDESVDLLKLIRIHSMPNATMLVPLSQETRDELRREIDGHTPGR